MKSKAPFSVPERVGDDPEADYSTSMPADYGPLARDLIPIRALQPQDLPSIAAIDRATTGRNRSAYFQRKLDEVLNDSDVRISLVAELDGRAVGYIMARVNLGEFGRSEPSAEMDTLGVDPSYQGRVVARALLSQLLANLATLRVDKALTEVDWTNTELVAFLTTCGFRPSSRLAFDLRLD